MSDYIPLDEWVDKNAKKLRKDIVTHIGYADDVARCIMASIRQWDEQQEQKLKTAEEAISEACEVWAGSEHCDCRRAIEWRCVETGEIVNDVPYGNCSYVPIKYKECTCGYSEALKKIRGDTPNTDNNDTETY